MGDCVRVSLVLFSLYLKKVYRSSPISIYDPINNKTQEEPSQKKEYASILKSKHQKCEL